jgi:hypothetical protein
MIRKKPDVLSGDRYDGPHVLSAALVRRQDQDLADPVHGGSASRQCRVQRQLLHR